MSTKIKELDSIKEQIWDHAKGYPMQVILKGDAYCSRQHARITFACMMRLIDQINMGKVSTVGWSKRKCRSVARKFGEAMYWWLYRSDCCSWTLGAHTGTPSWVRCAETSGHYTLWMLRMVAVDALTNRGGDR